MRVQGTLNKEIKMQLIIRKDTRNTPCWSKQYECSASKY